MNMKKIVVVLVLVVSVFALTGCSWYIGEGPAGFEMGIYKADSGSMEFDFRSNGEGVVTWDAPASSDYDTIYDPFTWELHTGNGRADEIFIDYETSLDEVIRVISPRSFRIIYWGELGETLYEKQWSLFAW